MKREDLQLFLKTTTKSESNAALTNPEDRLLINDYCGMLTDDDGS